MKNEILIVDILNIYSLFSAVTRYRDIRLIHYLRKGRFVNTAVKLLTKLGWSFELIQYSLDSFGGKYPFKELNTAMLDTITTYGKKVFSGELKKLNISEYEHKRLLTCFSSHMGMEIYFEMQLFILLSVNNLFENKNIKAILLRKSLFSDVLKEIYERRKFSTYFYRSFDKLFIPRELYSWDKAILRARKKNYRKIIKIILFSCCSLVFKTALLFLKSTRNMKKHKICVLLSNSFGTVLSNGLPWGVEEPSYLRDETIAFYRETMPKEAMDFYKKRSDKFVKYSLNPINCGRNVEIVKPWSDFAGFLIKNISRYLPLFNLHKINRWLFGYIFDVIVDLSFFEPLFLFNGTKILWFIDSDNTHMQVAAIAINRVGGISLGTSGSLALLPEWSIHHNKNDIFFVWGKRFLNISINTKDQSDSFVMTGHFADKAFLDEIKKAEEFRSSLTKKYRIKNVVTFFDTGSGWDQFITPRRVFEIYEQFFAWLNEDNSNFLVIKAKGQKTINKYPELKKEIDKFCTTGHALISYERSAVYPGLAADVALSASPTLSSITAMLGRPVIFYDIQGTYDEYSFALPTVSVIDDVCKMREAINIAIRKKQNLGYQYKLGPIKDSAVDQFADGKSIVRMRAYIENLLEAFDQKHSNSAAIRFANDEHKKQWGEGTVTRGPLPVK
ncbi:MAG: hypothetical protein HQ549_04535 [Candidatus Omnitrophica bacterium]|nr:hypothetical protein [Candidatus Omnitrophota bacterium]